MKSSPLTQFWLMPEGTVVSQPNLKCGLWNSVSQGLVPAGSRDDSILLSGGRVHGCLMTALSFLLCSEAENGSFLILFTRIKAASESPEFLNVSKCGHICCRGHRGLSHLLASLHRLKRNLPSLKTQISPDKP